MHLRHCWRTLECNVEVRSGYVLDWRPQERVCLDCGRHEVRLGTMWHEDGVVCDYTKIFLEWSHKGPWWRIKP